MDTPVRRIPIRQLISNMQGQNDWFNGCMAYLMERLGEDAAYDYGFFSGVTGDSFTQVFSKDPGRMALCYSDSRPADAIQRAFEACGYGYDAFLEPRRADGARWMGVSGPISTAMCRLSPG